MEKLGFLYCFVWLVLFSRAIFPCNNGFRGVSCRGNREHRREFKVGKLSQHTGGEMPENWHIEKGRFPALGTLFLPWLGFPVFFP